MYLDELKYSIIKELKDSKSPISSFMYRRNMSSVCATTQYQQEAYLDYAGLGFIAHIETVDEEFEKPTFQVNFISSDKIQSGQRTINIYADANYGVYSVENVSFVGRRIYFWLQNFRLETRDYHFRTTENHKAFKIIFDVTTMKFVGSEDVRKMISFWRAQKTSSMNTYIEARLYYPRLDELDKFLKKNKVLPQKAGDIMTIFKNQDWMTNNVSSIICILDKLNQYSQDNR